MSTSRNFDVCGLNIRVHTQHTSSEYVRLWKALHRTKRYISHANTALMIGDVHFVNQDDPTAGLQGHFYRFLDVDPSHPWFNIDKHKKATEEDVEKVAIPAELKPGLVEIPYFFDVKLHRLYFVAHETAANLSPKMVERLLETLCAGEKILEAFGKVDLTVITDKGRVDEMLSWPVLRKLTIVLNRPNPTDKEDEDFFYGKMAERRIASQVIIYKKAPEEVSIVPDEEMKRLAHVAANNGVVQVSGKNRKRWSANASSKDFPLEMKGSYFPGKQTLMDALKGVIEAFKPKKP